MKKLLIGAIIAGLSFGAAAKRPMFDKEGDYLINVAIFYGADIKGKQVLHLKIDNFQNYDTQCMVTHIKTNREQKIGIKAKENAWIYNITMPVQYKLKCALSE